MIAESLRNILACPNCKGSLDYQEPKQELWCRAEKLAYRIEDDIPILLIDEARNIDTDELAE